MGNRFTLRGEGTADIVPSGYASKSNPYLGGTGWRVAGCSAVTAAITRMDIDRIQPTSATLAPGETQTFTATATYCGAPMRWSTA